VAPPRPNVRGEPPPHRPDSTAHLPFSQPSHPHSCRSAPERISLPPTNAPYSRARTMERGACIGAAIASMLPRRSKSTRRSDVVGAPECPGIGLLCASHDRAIPHRTRLKPANGRVRLERNLPGQEKTNAFERRLREAARAGARLVRSHATRLRGERPARPLAVIAVSLGRAGPGRT